MVDRGPDAGIYVHLPFCKRLCPYCDFYSEVWDKDRVAAFVKALRDEIVRRRKTPFGEMNYDSVYFGGGTPSVFNPGQIDEILLSLDSQYRISDNAEITIECNPESISLDKARRYSNSGINRVSLGVQTFDDNRLAELGRIHDSKKAVESYEKLRRAGFDNMNIDLIFGLPGQTCREWSTDLRKAIELEPEHVSAYNLIIEPGTEFGRRQAAGRLNLPSDEDQESMYDQLVAEMAKAGYSRYEVSNFAEPGCECGHNLKYWNRIPWLGLGPSAVSFDGRYRTKNPADLDIYMRHISDGTFPPQEREELDGVKALEEAIMLGLRLAKGLSLAVLLEEFGYDILSEKQDEIKTLVENDLIELIDSHIRLTPKALFLADEITVKLI